MAPSASSSSSIQFIDTALWCTSPFALSYADPDQKWLIRKHLLLLLQDYPSFVLSNDTFTHDDGTDVNLLKVSGRLHFPRSTTLPSFHFTIWLHENYPSMAPLVIVSPHFVYPVRQNHPFVTPCGKIATPYLQTWSHPGCNLNDLVRNLFNIFSHDHPLICGSPVYEPRSPHPSMVSKREALDRLVGILHYDTLALQAKAEEETEELLMTQAELRTRAGVIRDIVSELEREGKKLKERVAALAESADVVSNWLKVNCDTKAIGVLFGDGVEDAFEAIDEESSIQLDRSAADEAIEDVTYALDKAVEEGVVSFDSYIRQVRVLAREQFFHRHLLIKLNRRPRFTVLL